MSAKTLSTRLPISPFLWTSCCSLLAFAEWLSLDSGKKNGEGSTGGKFPNVRVLLRFKANLNMKNCHWIFLVLCSLLFGANRLAILPSARRREGKMEKIREKEEEEGIWNSQVSVV